jgi:hypothetical protein
MTKDIKAELRDVGKTPTWAGQALLGPVSFDSTRPIPAHWIIRAIFGETAGPSRAGDCDNER